MLGFENVLSAASFALIAAQLPLSGVHGRMWANVSTDASSCAEGISCGFDDNKFFEKLCQKTPPRNKAGSSAGSKAGSKAGAKKGSVEHTNAAPSGSSGKMTLKTEKRLKQAGKSTQRATPRRRLYDSAEANPAWSLPGDEKKPPHVYWKEVHEEATRLGFPLLSEFALRNSTNGPPSTPTKKKLPQPTPTAPKPFSYQYGSKAPVNDDSNAP